MKKYTPKDGEDEFQIRMAISFANYLFLINRPKYIDFKKCRNINVVPIRKEEGEYEIWYYIRRGFGDYS